MRISCFPDIWYKPRWLVADGFSDGIHLLPIKIPRFLQLPECLFKLWLHCLQVMRLPESHLRKRRHFFFWPVFSFCFCLSKHLCSSLSGSENIGLIGFSWRAIDNDGFPALDDFTLWFAAKRIDSSLFDSAICDGASNWVLFRKIYAPIVRPYVMIAAFLSIAESWNLLEQPMTFLQSKERYPLSMILMQLSTDNAELKNVLCLLFAVPLMILFCTMVKKIIDTWKIRMTGLISFQQQGGYFDSWINSEINMLLQYGKI